jgi:hypothetical protein
MVATVERRPARPDVRVPAVRRIVHDDPRDHLAPAAHAPVVVFNLKIPGNIGRVLARREGWNDDHAVTVADCPSTASR